MRSEVAGLGPHSIFRHRLFVRTFSLRAQRASILTQECSATISQLKLAIRLFDMGACAE